MLEFQSRFYPERGPVRVYARGNTPIYSGKWLPNMHSRLLQYAFEQSKPISVYLEDSGQLLFRILPYGRDE